MNNRADTWLEKHPPREVSPDISDRMPCPECKRQDMCARCCERVRKAVRRAACNGAARQGELI